MSSSVSTQPWWRSFTRQHWTVFIVASLAWLFDCLDQQFFNLARDAALEQLMAAAWQQVGQVVAVNRILRQGQLARAASSALYHSSLHPLPDADVLAVAGPALGRILSDDGTTVEARIRTARVPGALFDPSARRVLRPRGPVGRRSGRRVQA